MMSRSWSLACCVLLTSLSVCCANHPRQLEQQSTTEHLDAKNSARTQIIANEGLTESKEVLWDKRMKRDSAECSVLETEGRSGLQEIVDARDETAYFYIQPKPGFRRLVFRLKENNKFDLRSWKYASEKLDISSSQLNNNWTHPTWIPVEVEYFKKEKAFGRDRHALRIKVGEEVDEVLVTSWWRTHSYEGFTIYAEGPLKVSKCNLQSARAESIEYEGERPILLILGLLGACLLLLVGLVIIYLTMRCSRTPRDNSPPVSRVSKSLLSERHNNRESDSDNIYETIDEVKLAKLRQNLDSETLGRSQGKTGDFEASTKELRETTQALWAKTFCREYPSSKVPGEDSKETLGLSLVEEKEVHRQHYGLDSPLESHYVEMHGIVSRTSSQSK